jgi:hypothetical protein
MKEHHKLSQMEFQAMTHWEKEMLENLQRDGLILKDVMGTGTGHWA